jgi:acyl-coenzyme A synthetase/AMP-(fatty) acid ligase
LIFWIEKSLEIKYSDFINDLKSDSWVTESDNYNYFLKLIKNLISENIITDIDHLLKYLKKNSNKLYFNQNTSGTTSKPKLIKVNLEKCIRNVKYTNTRKSWALCYPVESFASKQVFFQALFNKEKIVFCYNNYFKESLNQIINNKISNLTCTPTFLNMLIINSNKKATNVKTITLGGEKLSKSLINSYKVKFPRANLINIYASTEAGSLLYSNDDKFSIPNKYKNKIKIQNNELLIHNSLINKSKEISFSKGWYHSNDKVKMIDKNSFIFIERENSYINSGGFRISPLEIEEKMMKIEGIKDVRIYSKSNSFLGSILCAEVISNNSITPKYIKFELSKNLEKFKIPQIIDIVKNIKLTASGKKQR